MFELNEQNLLFLDYLHVLHLVKLEFNGCFEGLILKLRLGIRLTPLFLPIDRDHYLVEYLIDWLELLSFLATVSIVHYRILFGSGPQSTVQIFLALVLCFVRVREYAHNDLQPHILLYKALVFGF